MVDRSRTRKPLAGDSWLGATFEVAIERVAHGGHCVARHGGRVVFVRHTIPGERVVVVVTEDSGGSFCRADAVEVIEPSPHRVEPPCRFSGAGKCGGCDWQHVDPAYQRAMKAAVVREQLRRLAGVEHDVVVEAASPSPLAWRTRMQYAVEQGRVGLRQHRSHELIEPESCVIAARGAGIDIARERVTPDAASIEVETGANARSTVSAIDRRGRRTVLAGGPQCREVAGRTFTVHSGGFWQVHHDAAALLSDCVIELAAAQVGETVLDLYCGAGLFAARLGEIVGVTGRVIGYEGTPSAVRDAQRNVSDLPHVVIERASIDAATVDRAGGNIDIVVLDPPRTGAKRAVVESVCTRAPRAVVYVACDPASLARDVGIFAEHGYRLAQLRAFDLFPMTHHVECVALLQPAPGE